METTHLNLSPSQTIIFILYIYMNWIDVDLGFQFYFSLLASESGGHSLVKNHKSGAIEVEVKNLDDVVEELGLDKVSPIKDAEGAKYAILRGAMNTPLRGSSRGWSWKFASKISITSLVC